MPMPRSLTHIVGTGRDSKNVVHLVMGEHGPYFRCSLQTAPRSCISEDDDRAVTCILCLAGPYGSMSYSHEVSK